jgi:hypothetical protein
VNPESAVITKFHLLELFTPVISNNPLTLRISQLVPGVPVKAEISQLYVDPPKTVAELAVKSPGLLPGDNKEPLLKVKAPTLPEPAKLPPVFTVTAPAVPFTFNSPPSTNVLELLAIAPLFPTNKVPDVSKVSPR